jgi:hypothetical protein
VKHFIDKAREFIGDLWGYVTTQGLVLLAGIQAALIQADPRLLTGNIWIPRIILGISIVVLVLRQFAPPAPSVAIKRGDTVAVDREVGAVAIVKAEGVPAALVDKAPGQTLNEAATTKLKETE